MNFTSLVSLLYVAAYLVDLSQNHNIKHSTKKKKSVQVYKVTQF